MFEAKRLDFQWCSRRESNPHSLTTNRVWVYRVYLISPLEQVRVFYYFPLVDLKRITLRFCVPPRVRVLCELLTPQNDMLPDTFQANLLDFVFHPSSATDLRAISAGKSGNFDMVCRFRPRFFHNLLSGWFPKNVVFKGIFGNFVMAQFSTKREFFESTASTIPPHGRDTDYKIN